MSAASGKLQLMHLVEQLKTQKRTGWVKAGVKEPESIADHMYRMSILALLSDDTPDLDILKCVALCVVHDLAEATVGDITPHDGVSKEEKIRRETEAMEHFLTQLLPSNAASSQRIRALWQEYEAAETPEARFVKDLDRFELGLQAVEYEQAQGIDLTEFLDSTQPKIASDEVKGWSSELCAIFFKYQKYSPIFVLRMKDRRSESVARRGLIRCPTVVKATE